MLTGEKTVGLPAVQDNKESIDMLKGQIMAMERELERWHNKTGEVLRRVCKEETPQKHASASAIPV